MGTAATLFELLGSLDDPGSPRGERHPPDALLALAVVAMLVGQTTHEAIVQYGKGRGWPFLRLLGSARRLGSCKAIYSRAFLRIDAVAFEVAVGRLVRARLKPGDAPHLAIDGDCLRGSRGCRDAGGRLVAAYAPDAEAVVGRLRVDAKTGEHKAALELLGVLPPRGRVVAADGMFARRDVCAAALGRGGDCLLPARENRPTPASGIAAAFAGPPGGLTPPAGVAP